MKAIMTGVALAALIAAAPAAAQTQPAQQDMQGTAACPAGTSTTAMGEACPPDAAATAPTTQPGDTAATPAAQQPDAMATGSLPSDNANQADTAQTGATQGQPADMVAEARGKFIEEQADNTVLASDLIGRSVYNPGGDVLGDVNDIVWTGDGSIAAVVVGVGGFLGIGEKNVAVAYEAVTIGSDENGDTKLVLDASADELAAAPEFVTSADKVAMLQQQQQDALPSSQGGGMSPAVPTTQPAQPTQ